MRSRLRSVALVVGLLFAVSVLGLLPASADAQALGNVRKVSFSGHDWLVRSTADTRLGPGPNYFSDSTRNAWVDGAGKLHLRIERRGDRWYSAEVISVASFGYGTYRWYLDSPVDTLDPNVVLGLFTWNDDPAQNHRELDIEFARWSNAAYASAQYTVQPYAVPGNQVTFSQPAGASQSTHSLTWAPGSAAFSSVRGHDPTTADPSLRIASTTITQGVPASGGENARMNLWLYEGNQPTDRQDVEIVVSRFEFVPPAAP